ncbi:Coiled-coil domain-containing protein 13 [Bulinus truncatus]|nr:Coiled-coil domain-containing protein 13 [Bulinus truncatus]
MARMTWLNYKSNVLLILMDISLCLAQAGYKLPHITEPKCGAIYYPNVGDNGRLTCTAEGNPQPTYKWLHNRKLLSPSEGVSLDGGYLRIQNFSSINEGEFICVASNFFKEDQNTRTVAILSYPIQIILAHLNVTNERQVKIIPVEQNSYVNLACPLGEIKPEYRYSVVWYDKNNKNVADEKNDRHYVDSRGKHAQHQISNSALFLTDHSINEYNVTGDRPATGSRIRDGTQSTRIMSRESTRTASVLGGPITACISSEELATIRYQCQELEIMSKAVEVEKDKMIELVKVLQDRLSEETHKISTLQAELQAQKRLTVDLEKKLGKLVLEGKKKGNSRGGNSARDLINVEDSKDDSDLNLDKSELQTRFEIMRDENETLKATLKRTIQAKEEDLKIYSSTLDETKKLFLQALRQKETMS